MQQMFPCPFCSAQNYVGQKFCGECGQKLDYNCPYCGAIVDPTMTVCVNCSSPLSWPTPPPTSPLPSMQVPPPMQTPPSMTPFQAREPQYQAPPMAHRHGGQAPRRKKPFPYGLLALIVVAIVLIVGGTLYALDMPPFGSSSDSTPPASDDTTPVGDSTAPAISSVTSNVTSSTAIISWTTDEPATSQVVYGTSTDYGMISQKNKNLVTSHSVELTSLEANTTYQFQVFCLDADDNEASSSNKQFATSAGEDTTPPEITGVSDNATAAAATIKWTTSEPATSQVDYGTTDSFGTLTTLDSELVTSHSVDLTGLQGSTKYFYKVISKDAAENEVTSTGNFNTLAADDSTPPEIIYLLADELTRSDNVTRVQISWGTDELSSSQVEYGVTPSYGTLSDVTDTPVASNGKLEHNVILEGLGGGQFYNYRVISIDAAGNETVSDNGTFYVDPPPT